MVSRPARPNSVLIMLEGTMVLSGVVSLFAPIEIGNKFLELTIGVIVLFASVVVYGRYRIDVSHSRRVRGFREWAGFLTSHRLMQMLLGAALVLGSWQIYEACLKIFIKVVD